MVSFEIGPHSKPVSGRVIPAKAGIHPASRWKCGAKGLDSRFRGNDRGFEGNPFPNGTTTLIWVVNRFAYRRVYPSFDGFAPPSDGMMSLHQAAQTGIGHAPQHIY